MNVSTRNIVELEKKFWQALVDEDTDAALDLLAEPALLVNAHGAMKFDHQGYRSMAEQASMKLKSFELSDVEVLFPNENTAVLSYHVEQTTSTGPGAAPRSQSMHDSSVWTRSDGQWRCALHTETPCVEKAAA